MSYSIQDLLKAFKSLPVTHEGQDAASSYLDVPEHSSPLTGPALSVTPLQPPPDAMTAQVGDQVNDDEWNQNLVGDMSEASGKNFSYDPRNKVFYDDELNYMIPGDQGDEALAGFRDMHPALAAMARGR